MVKFASPKDTRLIPFVPMKNLHKVQSWKKAGKFHQHKKDWRKKMRKYLIVLIGILTMSLMAATAMAGSQEKMSKSDKVDMFSAMDDNSDDSISRQEWFNYMTADKMEGMERDVDWDKGMTKEQYQERTFEQYDVDTNESISQKEWKQYMMRDHASFDEADIDRDERLSRDEYLVETYGAMDLNRDSRVSREEWFEFMEGK
jgi:hypothetical protein